MRRRTVLAGVAYLPASLLAACTVGNQVEVPLEPVRVIFFENESPEVSPEALAVIEDAADAARRYPSTPLRVLGYVAPDPQAQLAGLSRMRAENVAMELSRFDIPRERIAVAGRGATAFEAAPVEARRVEIRLGPE